jgi:very-short-patch-repair endonuclease
LKTSSLEKRFLALWQRRHLVGGPPWVAELPEPQREFRFHPVRKWPFDFAWPAYKVAVEMDGGIFIGGKAHASGPGIHADHAKRNTAAEMGWRVLVYSARDVGGAKSSIGVIQQVANLLHQGLAEGCSEQLELFR